MKFTNSSQISENLEHDFDWFQLEEASLCREHGIDDATLARFFKPEISFLTMRELRKGLEAGINLVDFAGLGHARLRELRKGTLASLDLTGYIRDGYQADQVREIRHALEKGICPDEYITKEYTGLSIREIVTGLEHGIDVTAYAKIDYGAAQMRELRLGLEHHIDQEVYANPLYSADQMKEIRLGLEEGLPVEEYKSFLYTAEAMKGKREELKARLTSPARFTPGAAREPAISMPGAFVRISEDGLEATVELTEGFTPCSKTEFILWLRQNEIYSGIDELVLSEILSPYVKAGSYVIAKGREARTGEDGFYEYFVDREAALKDKDFKANIENYKTVRWFASVKKGQRIALYHKSKEGTDGFFVNGQILPAARGKELPILIGTGIHSEEGNVVYFADYDGKIDMIDNEVHIIPMLELAGLNPNDGPVSYEGFVHIAGDVESGCRVSAARGMLIDGTVYNAELESGEDVVLRRGMTGDGRGSIRAEGNIVGCFFEEARLTARGSIYSDSCVNCEIHGYERIQIEGKLGRLIGGNCYGSLGITAGEIGNDVGLRTGASVGVDETGLTVLHELETLIRDYDKELGLLETSYEKVLYGGSDFGAREQLIELRLERAIHEKKKEKQEAQERLEQLTQRVHEEKKSAILVQNRLYENVLLQVNGNRMFSMPMGRAKISGVGKMKVEGQKL